MGNGVMAMIEIICNGKEREAETKGTVQKELPKNIRQVGDVGAGRRIYIEDYAFTYINSVAYQQPEAETAGVLLGEVAGGDGGRCIFIKGVIKAKSAREDSGEICFDESVWSQIYGEIEKYFPNLSIVGWFAALPRVTSEAVCRMKKLHYDNFAGKEKAMYLIDIEEKEENFYLYENGDIQKQRGYVCFYERNYEMQEYMLEKNRNKSVEKPDAERVVRSVRTLMREKEEEKRQKRSAFVSYAACAFMASVVGITGINLVRSYEKMKKIDSSISSIVQEVSNLGVGQTSTVVSDEVVPVSVIYETKATEEASIAAGNGTTQATSAADANTNGGTGNATTGGTAGNGTAENTTTAASSDATQVSAEITYKKYTVQKGDTILGISKKYYGSTEKAAQIIEINNLTDADKLYIGQEIKLP
jgi:LysM repeat protein